MLPPHVATSIEEFLICFSSWAGNWWNTDQCYDGEEVDAHSNGTHPVHNNTVSPVEEVSHTLLKSTFAKVLSKNSSCLFFFSIGREEF